MESDWHPRARTLPAHSPPAALPSLPSVAELLASSSRPASDSVAAYHHHQTCSPQLSTYALSPAVNPPPPSVHSHRGAANHTIQASPAESATTISSTEQQHHQQPHVKSAAPPFTLLPNAAVSQAHGPDHSLPVNCRRQDSAVAQQSIDEANNHQGHRPASPISLPRPASWTPALPAPSHGDATTSVSHEHVGCPSAPIPHQAASDSSHRRLQPPSFPDQTTTSNTRQQRYNVRFAANHTPSNMLSAPKPRASPPLSTAPLHQDAINSPSPPTDEHAARSIEPAIQAINRTLQTSDEPSQPEGRAKEQSVDRCPHCHEVWDRPLPNPAEWGQDSPAENANGFARANMNLMFRIMQHGKEADQKYEQWKEKHSHCPRNGHREQANGSAHAGSTDASHMNGHPQAEEQVRHLSSKRKSEVPHGENSKLRRVTFDAPTSTAPEVHPPASL